MRKFLLFYHQSDRLISATSFWALVFANINCYDEVFAKEYVAEEHIEGFKFKLKK